MKPNPSITHRFPLSWLSLSIALLVSLPFPLMADKTLASRALAAAIENGTLDQVSQEVLLDSVQKSRYEIDEAGIEALGRKLLGAGSSEQAVQVLQLNQLIHPASPGAAVALADAYTAAGEEMQARVFYDMALDMDPGNEAAKRGAAGTPDPHELASGAMAAMGDWELDPEAMQEAMAQMGVEISPEQMAEMQEAMAQLQQFQESGAMPPAATSRPSQEPARETRPSEPTPQYESEFCGVLHRFNAEKRIPDATFRARFEGNYQEPDHADWTWNIESTCGDFLVAVPLWADVSPPVLEHKGENRFLDATGATWEFEMGGDGKAERVLRTDDKGTRTSMPRQGDPRSY